MMMFLEVRGWRLEVRGWRPALSVAEGLEVGGWSRLAGLTRTRPGLEIVAVPETMSTL
jgi:hypothetical protein